MFKIEKKNLCSNNATEWKSSLKNWGRDFVNYFPPRFRDPFSVYAPVWCYLWLLFLDTDEFLWKKMLFHNKQQCQNFVGNQATVLSNTIKICKIGEGSSINYVVSVGGRGVPLKTISDDKGGGGGLTQKLCCLFVFQILPFFEVLKTQKVFPRKKLLQKKFCASRVCILCICKYSQTWI